MPNDIPDWTDATVVSGTTTISAGSVDIVGGQGGSTNVLTAAPPVVNTTATMLSGHATVSKTITPGIDATGCLIVCPPTNVLTAPYTIVVEVVGGTTGVVLVNETSITLQGLTVALGPESVIEGTLLLTVTYLGNVGANTVVATAYDVVGSGVQFVEALPNQPLPVYTPLNSYTSIKDLVVGNGIMSATHIDFGAAAVGGVSHVIAAAAGKTITIFGYSWSFDTNNHTGLFVATLQSTAGGYFDALHHYESTAVGSGTSATHEPHIPAGGFSLGVGAGLDVQNSAGSAGTINVGGVVIYTQV